MSSTIAILILAFIGSVIALVGGFVFLFNKEWSDFLERHSVPFAAGVLLTVSFVGLLPEAIDMIGEQALLVTLISFVGAYLFEHAFFHVHHHGHHHNHKDHHRSALPLIILGDTIHNFIDGVAIASTYMVAPGLGVITTLSTFLHEVPHEIADFGILLKAGWSRKRVLIVNVLSAATAIVGALFVIFFINSPQVIGMFLSVSAGIFLYLGASDFLPHIEEGKRPLVPISAFIAGIVIMIAALNIIPHSHAEEGHDEDEHAHIETQRVEPGGEENDSHNEQEEDDEQHPEDSHN